MASNIRPIPPPLSAPMVDENGIVTSVWGNFFNNIFRYQQEMAKLTDKTYKIGIGATKNGLITTEVGIITAIQEVV